MLYPKHPKVCTLHCRDIMLRVFILGIWGREDVIKMEERGEEGLKHT